MRLSNISIHALLAESNAKPKETQQNPEISIHALLAESDTWTIYSASPTATFLSTLSLRRATALLALLDHNLDDFYPRSPCGERQPIP